MKKKCFNRQTYFSNKSVTDEYIDLIFYKEKRKFYCFDYKERNKLLETRKNPFTNKKLSRKFIKKLQNAGPKLTTMPIELVGEIKKYLSIEDITNLRLTNKQLNEQIKFLGKEFILIFLKFAMSSQETIMQLFMFPLKMKTEEIENIITQYIINNIGIYINTDEDEDEDETEDEDEDELDESYFGTETNFDKIFEKDSNHIIPVSNKSSADKYIVKRRYDSDYARIKYIIPMDVWKEAGKLYFEWEQTTSKELKNLDSGNYILVILVFIHEDFDQFESMFLFPVNTTPTEIKNILKKFISVEIADESSDDERVSRKKSKKVKKKKHIYDKYYIKEEHFLPSTVRINYIRLLKAHYDNDELIFAADV